MGFFDTFRVMKDIVTGGIEAYKAGEKLNELIEKATDDYEDVLTAQEKSLYETYKKSSEAYNDNSDTDKTNELLEKLEDDRIAFLEALTQNSSLPKSFRNEIKDALEEFKKADNKALNTLGEVLEKNAETEEERAEIRRQLQDTKK